MAIFFPVLAVAQEQDFTISASETLQNTGFLEFLLPRFSLKMGIRAEILYGVENADFWLDTETGTAIMEGLGARYYGRVSGDASPRAQKAQRFAEWLTSDIGKRTIAQFAQNGQTVFVASEPEQQAEIAPVFYGDIARGEQLAFANCGRCHVIGDRNRMKGIGSTPSFGLMRGLPDWNERFTTFFSRNPHPVFTQIEGVTDPFPANFPSPIFPLSITVDEMEDILTYVSTIRAVDLGAPLIEHQ